MIEYAYALRDFQVTGGPSWLNNATWDILAKIDRPVPNWTNLRSDDRRAIMRQRMAAVLAQRFNLKCHFETKQLPVYNLVLARGGPKLKQPTADTAKKGSTNWDGEGRQNKMDGTGVELTAFADMLSQALGRTVINKTGLSGISNFTLSWTSDPNVGSPAASTDSNSGPTIFTALEEQLGLKLEPAKGPVPVLVVDSVQKPSEN